MNQDIKNVIPLLTLMAVSIMFSCTHKIKKDSVKVPTEIVSVPTPAPVSSPLPVELGTVNVKLIPMNTLSKDEIILTINAQEKMNQVVQSKCFYDFMANRKMIQTNNRTDEEVAKHIQSIKGEIPVNFYYTAMKNRFNPFGTSAVAYRQPPSNQININRAYYTARANLCEYAGTLAHESIGHSLGGYDHDYYATANRNYSVPYSLNFAFEKCCH
jgi:hypothetical protein